MNPVASRLMSEARVIGYRQGIGHKWPIYDRVPFDPSRDMWPPAIGGTCPPYAPLSELASGGYACVESPEGFGQLPFEVGDDQFRQLSLRAFDHVWPTMRERLRTEMRAERKIMIATAAGVGLFVVAATALLKRI